MLQGVTACACVGTAIEGPWDAAVGVLRNCVALLGSTSSCVLLHSDLQALWRLCLLPPAWLIKLFFGVGTFPVILLPCLEGNDWDYGFCSKNWSINSFKTFKQFTFDVKEVVRAFQRCFTCRFSRDSPLSLMQSHGAPEPELVFAVNQQMARKVFLSLCRLHWYLPAQPQEAV